MSQKCEYCNEQAKYIDSSAIDKERSGIHQADVVYRNMPLCSLHALERKESNTSRIKPMKDE